MRLLTIALAGALSLSTTTLNAGTIANACMKSDRNPTRATCQCIQQVADQKLTETDQKRAAVFFQDPHKSQVVRQSSKKSDEILWERWKAFGEAAGKRCG